MIHLERERTASAITGGLRGHHRKRKERRLIDEFLTGAFDFQSNYWKKAKPQLIAESHAKCAYCEADTRTVAHGDVEHFRPKSVYWWLAYCYDNYLFSCQICNQTYKGNAFPVSGTPLIAPAVPVAADDAQRDALSGTLAPDPLDEVALTTFRRLTHDEQAHIPDPYALDPETLFAWAADDVLREVVVQPRDPSDPLHRRAYRAAVKQLGLNRAELRHVRYGFYRILRNLRAVLGEPQISVMTRAETREVVRTMTGADQPFAAMVRHFVRVWQLDLD